MTGRAPPPEFHAHRNDDTWAWAVAVSVAATLRRHLQQRRRARLLVSGGTTPGPVFRALSRAPIDWARIVIGLVDERWLPVDDPASNSLLVREQLLRDHAAAATFQPLVYPDCTLDQSVKRANERAASADVVLLGMGDDGHTASLFPGMADLDRALLSEDSYVAVDASGSPGAGPWPHRISLTPAGMASARTRLLLIRGSEKRALFQRAREGNDPHELPVRVAFATPGAVLHVHWCP